MLTEDKITKIYCILDDHFKIYLKEIKKHKILGIQMYLKRWLRNYSDFFGDKGYISALLFETLFNDGIHLVTGIKGNMKNSLMSLYNKILLHKRSVIETINDQLKNICKIEHSRHRAVHGLIINLISTLTSYCFFDKKTAIRLEMVPKTVQFVVLQ
jgi:ADP-ribosylglycohydrolase